MQNISIAQLLFALLEGLGLILSPCILPILPIVLASSLDGGKRRPLGIITGFIVAFSGFALLSRQILGWLHIDSQIVRDTALILLIIFGLTMMSRKVSDKLLSATQGLANFGQNITTRWSQTNGYMGGVAIGTLIGAIWTPCAGPIMAAAIVQIIQARNNFEATLTVIMFALGAGLPMLLVALMGRTLLSRMTFLKTNSYAVRKGLGIIIILTAILIYKGADVSFLASPLSKSTISQETTKQLPQGLVNGLDAFYRAPVVTPTQEWINSSPLKIAELRGKVVLVDFWTYSCINCLRTLPYVTQWYDRYHDKGFIVVGVHSPEFDFEKKINNVQNAVFKYGIHYPVVLDNDLAIWDNFSNKYWPAHYLINKEGQVVYVHYGEGDYNITEHNIRFLLGLSDDHDLLPSQEFPTYSEQQTPETYLGYSRAQNFALAHLSRKNLTTDYTFPNDLHLHQWSINGSWKIEAEHITAMKAGAALRLHFKARKIFLVLGTEHNTPVNIHLLLNSTSPGAADGADVTEDKLTVKGERLYELINQELSKEGTLELTADQPGLQAYAFTFGN